MPQEKRHIKPGDFMVAILSIVLLMALIRVMFLVHKPLVDLCAQLSLDMTRGMTDFFNTLHVP